MRDRSLVHKFRSGLLFALILASVVYTIIACTPIAGLDPRMTASADAAPIPADGNPRHDEQAPTATNTGTPTTTPTATPTATASPTPVEPWEYFPAPIKPSAIEIRRPIRPHEANNRLINILLLGSDQRPYEAGHRTDMVMLISIDPDSHSVKLLSVPRDLYVYIPGWRVDRINVADGMGGPEMVKDAILYNFGFEVDYWVRVNFTGFIRMVDELGGIEVEVGAYLQDKCGRVWSYSPAVYHMDGFQALCYVRMRKTTGDFDRLRRQQEVVLALFQRFLSIKGITRLPELNDQFRNHVETDMNLEDTFRLLPVAASASRDPMLVALHRIGEEMGTMWRVPSNGASVILPNWDLIEAMLAREFGWTSQPGEGPG